MSNFLDSKTHVQVLISLGFTLVLIVFGVAVWVFTNHNPIDYIVLGVGKLLGDNSLLTYRNVKVDGPIRVQQATLDTAIQAKKADVDPMVWTPPTNGGTP